MTSGTTGSPKAAVLSFANLMESAKTTNEFYNVCTGDSWQLNLPIHHIAGLMIPIRMLIACGKVHAKQSSYSDFHSLVPTQLYRALREDKWKQYRESKAVIVGGAHLPDSLYQKALKLGLPISKTYGSTESCSGISATKPGLISKSHSTGKKFAHLDVKISDGLLKFRGQSLFLGYVQDDKSISKEVDPEGYFSTNDLAKIDKDGEIFIQGRKDEIFISGGENVDPQVINDLCLQHIPDCIPIVIPVSDEEMGQRAHLIFWGITVPDRELLEFLFDSLKTPWRPKMCTFCSMNQAPLGKITRKQTELFLKDGGGIKVF
jgi:O-succinylbenzoic acid--CoA ligase